MSRSRQDVCICKHALKKHDEDGCCEEGCDACAEDGFRIDKNVSPELTEADVAGHFDGNDREKLPLAQQRASEIALDKIAFQVFGVALNDLLARVPRGKGAGRGARQW